MPKQFQSSKQTWIESPRWHYFLCRLQLVLSERTEWKLEALLEAWKICLAQHEVTGDFILYAQGRGSKAMRMREHLEGSMVVLLIEDAAMGNETPGEKTFPESTAFLGQASCCLRYFAFRSQSEDSTVTHSAVSLIFINTAQVQRFLPSFASGRGLLAETYGAMWLLL